MTKKSIDPFDQFYCMSAHDSNMAFTSREILQDYGDKVCIGRKSLHKFGESEVVGNSESPIHPWGEFEEYQTSNVTLNLSSSSASDTALVTIEYMFFDINGDMNFGTQTKTLTGRTPVTLTDTGCRWMRMYTNDDVTGNVYLYRGTESNGTPSDMTKVHNQIVAGLNQSQKASTSIAKGNYLVLTSIWSDVVRKSAVSAALNFKVRKLGSAFRTRPRRGLGEGNSLDYNITPYIIIEPNSDIEITAQTDSNSPTNMTAGFNGYFADIIS